MFITLLNFRAAVTYMQKQFNSSLKVLLLVNYFITTMMSKEGC